ncbi:MAG TPA: hypothetical protein VGC14_15705, partial [Rhizobium sp.]
MFVKKLAAALLAVMAIATSAAAQSPTRIEQFKAWGAYFYQGGTGKVCYVLTVPDPKQLTPPKVDHGDVFFLVT